MAQAGYILIYDDKCALCAWYSNVFVKLGLLNNTGRLGFAQAPEQLLAQIDLDRAGNEIPLYDTATKQVVYGIDALVTVLSQKQKWIKTFAQLKPVDYCLRKLYKLISYNRKGIVAHIPSTEGYECAPGYSYNYKKFFIVLCYLLSCILLIAVHDKTLHKVADWLYLLSGFISLFAILTTDKKYLEFAMQWQLQVLISLVLLIPFTLLLPHINLAAVLYFAIISVLILMQIRRRIKYLVKYFKQSN
ncbi:MAG: hypothetical protein RL660_2360 [Bacteroidota bacterium]|jgi:predicted DCC family thiol-disulfide oxidoreductase YuxK